MREDAPVVIAGISTGDYPMDARIRLGQEVYRARRKAGIRSQKELAKRAGISVRSVAKVENPDGEPPVGRSVLTAIAAVLPGWTEDTPRQILEGGKAPEPEHLGSTLRGPAAIYAVLEEVGWSAEEEEEFQMYKRMLAKGGLKLTVKRYIEMRHDFELEDNTRQPTPDDGK